MSARRIRGPSFSSYPSDGGTVQKADGVRSYFLSCSVVKFAHLPPLWRDISRILITSNTNPDLPNWNTNFPILFLKSLVAY